MGPFETAWAFIKALPEQQMYHEGDSLFDWTARGRRLGTIHPAIAGLLEREAAKIPKRTLESNESEGYLVPAKTSMDMFGESVNQRRPPSIQNIPGPANWRYPPRNPDETQDEFKERQKQVRASYLDPDYDEIRHLKEQFAAQEAAAQEAAGDFEGLSSQLDNLIQTKGYGWV